MKLNDIAVYVYDHDQGIIIFFLEKKNYVPGTVPLTLQVLFLT